MPTAEIVGYGVGTTGLYPLHGTLAVLGGAFALVVVLSVVTGTVIVPGLLLILVARGLLCPARAVVVGDQGVAIVKRSFVNGKPNQVLTWLPHHLVSQAESKGRHVRLVAGSESVWLTRKEYDEACSGGARLVVSA